MFIYYKDPNSKAIREIHGPSIPARCVSGEIEMILGSRGTQLHDNLVEIANNCEILTCGNYAYFAWIERSSNLIGIYHAVRKDPYTEGQQEEGRFVTGFNGDCRITEGIENFLMKQLLASWLQIVKYRLGKLSKVTLCNIELADSIQTGNVGIQEVIFLLSQQSK